jgi:Fur family ferric uptake transcriptional regulator
MTLSTVYRALEALEEADLVTHTHLGHSPLTYHAVDDHQHIHLVCETCQQVISADSSLADALRHQIAQAYDFDVDPTHMAIAGRCKNCRVVAP